jgi:Phosphodiester glycosidase
VLLVLLGILAVPAYSYTTTMLKPSSLPLGVRTVEWVRANHGAWLVNTFERYWYTWHAPKKGGPALTALPAVGLTDRTPAGEVARRSHRVRRPADPLPPRITPAISPALSGEGRWNAIGPPVNGGPALLATTFRPDPVYPRTVAYVAWIDHSRTRLALYPGRYEPPTASPRGPMEVPSSQRWRLLATFNSGFTYGDGHGGFFVNGDTAAPLQQGLGTLVEYRDGSVDVVSWRGGATPRPWIVLARQNLPLLVSGGRPSPKIADGSLWGATLGNAIRVWRSGVGVDARGNLIYAAADAQTAQSLAEILVRAGAVRAIELDINAEWPSFIMYSHRGGLFPVKLVPNGMQPAGRYLVPDDRDFFAVYRVVPGGSASVPFG